MIHDALRAASLAHAFGGAIALAYCVEEPRGTRDLDLNIFADAAKAKSVLANLPEQVTVGPGDVAAVIRDGQTRLWWEDTPVDVFLNTLPLHRAVAAGVIWVPLQGREIPVLGCASLTIFKALFDRTKNWADIEAIAIASPEDIEDAATTIANLLGEDDPAYRRLKPLLA
ncbi:MAG TPA: hypothetical protein VND98_10725 [Solirubrobacterales bacterium]|nr:hypothetical protein [Solirubrobacterales bacterium]